MSDFSISNITAGYGKEIVIENISFDINEGELIGILGANGSGKSTLVKAICNILSHEGNVTIGGEVVEKLKVANVANLISYIPQHSGISIDISVLDVVMMGYNARLKLLQRPSKGMVSNAKAILTDLGLEEIIDSNYMLLSEGQKQLVILARALVSNGKLLIMDEPESALDFNVRYKMINFVKKWIGAGKRAGLIILHDTMLALNSCDKLILLKDKGILDVIDMHSSSLDDMQKKLSKIYGDISLVRNKDKNGKDHIVMVYDSEEV